MCAISCGRSPSLSALRGIRCQPQPDARLVSVVCLPTRPLYQFDPITTHSRASCSGVITGMASCSGVFAGMASCSGVFTGMASCSGMFTGMRNTWPHIDLCILRTCCSLPVFLKNNKSQLTYLLIGKWFNVGECCW